MKQQLSVITLPVNDLAVTRRFYCDGLGWQPVFINDEVMFIQLNGLVMSFFHRAAYEQDAGVDYRPGGHTCVLSHNVASPAEVDAVYAEALAAGAQPQKRPAMTPWGGYAGHFRDPDEHLWEIAHNPAWPISPEGYVTCIAPE